MCGCANGASTSTYALFLSNIKGISSKLVHATFVTFHNLGSNVVQTLIKVKMIAK